MGFHTTKRRKSRRWRTPRPILPDEVDAIREQIARESLDRAQMLEVDRRLADPEWVGERAFWKRLGKKKNLDLSPEPVV